MTTHRRRSTRRTARAVMAAMLAPATLPIVALSSHAPAQAAPTELFFSEYIEGSSNNKALEIHNGTGAAVDLAAGSYNVQMFFNGNPTAGLTINLTGTVADGDVFVLAQASASGTILAQADQTNGSGWYNGDDAVVLRRGATVVDSIGQVGFDPGSQWGTDLTSTADNTLRRKPDVCAGDTAVDDAFDPAATWTGFATDTFDGIGAHTTSCDGGPVDQPPVPSCPAALATTEGTAASEEVSATDDVDGIASIVITSTPIEGIALSGIDLAAGTATLDVGATTDPGNYQVVIEFSTDGEPVQSATCTIAVRVDPAGTSLISAVQGTAGGSPYQDLYVTIEGVVTSLFEDDDAADGFFVQEEDDDADEDPFTSEGIFVFCRNSCPTVQVGDLVTAAGVVSEFFGMTQLDIRSFLGGSLTVVSSENPLPTATTVELPASGSTRDAATFEPVEGMVVSFTDTLAVSEYFELARYGQLVLTVDARPFQFTHDHAPNSTGYAAFLDDLNTRRIILDDDNNDQNDAVTGPKDNEPYPWPAGGLSLSNRVRGGDTITGLTGVLHWSFAGQTGTDAWRVRPIQGQDYQFTPADPAPDTPTDVGGDLRVASYNVLNYFATIDTTPANNIGPCGPVGGLDCRGADSEVERVRQLAKIVTGLLALDADIAGLIEIQNDAGAATQQIVDALNAATAPGTYAAIDTGFIGTDAIKVALIYQPTSVVPIGEFAILDSSDDDRFLDERNRPVLIQTFEQRSTAGRFTVAVNHLKSKGTPCADIGDPDLLDGQGNCNLTRTAAAQALADHLATDPTDSDDPDFLIVGDLNAYRMEDPITTLENAGYTDLQERFEGDDAYSYVFDGQLGYLDTALANGSLLGQVTGTTSWHINADEVPLFDYNDDVADAGEASFERESNALPLYAPDPLRSSDHDPVLVGLAVTGPIDALLDTLHGLGLQRGIARSLAAKLDAARAALAAGDDAAACTALADFANQVRALRGKKLTAAQAELLLAQAAEARTLIGC